MGLIPPHYNHPLPQQPFLTGITAPCRGPQPFQHQSVVESDGNCYPDTSAPAVSTDPSSKLFAVFPSPTQQTASVPTLSASTFQPQAYFVYPNISTSSTVLMGVQQQTEELPSSPPPSSLSSKEHQVMDFFTPTKLNYNILGSFPCDWCLHHHADTTIDWSLWHRVTYSISN